MLQKPNRSNKSSYRGYQIIQSNDKLSALVYKNGNEIAKTYDKSVLHPYLTAVRNAQLHIDDLLKPVPMSKEMIKDFKKEFAALLTKYDVQIGFTCDSGSDTHGITGGKIQVQQNKTDLVVASADDWWMDRKDVI